MKPVSQTRISPEAGNCLEAAVASVLECALEEVPKLAGVEHWDMPLTAWLASRGFSLHTTAGDDPPAGWQIAVGPSPRNADERHAVVVHDGELVWDPHPSRDCFSGKPVQYFLVIERIPA